MYCKECGKKIDDDSKFCEYCGTRLKKDEATVTGIPQRPVSNDPYIDFVFPGMLETVKSYFQQDFGIDDNGNFVESYGMIEYYLKKNFKKKRVLQIIDYYDRDAEEKHYLMINFCLPDDKIATRLRNCIYKDDFDDEFAAYYGGDFEKMVKVVSYILAAVCGIPKNAKLEYSFETC